MKKNIFIVVPILLTVTAMLSVLLLYKKEQPFYLENQYYETNTMEEIDLEEYKHLVDRKESFALFVYQPMCVTSSDFEQVLNHFQKEYQISFKKIAFSKIKEETKFLKYYPSFILYKEGKMIDFLEADKEEDLNVYQSKEEFESWLTKYVKLKEKISNEKEGNKKTTEQESNDSKINVETIKQEKNKVNIYFFWGDGCPHCEQEFAFFNSIEDEYKEKYNLYPFEVWHNEENAKLLNTFAAAMQDKVTGVPYTIIGNKSFSGFGNNMKEEMKEAINNLYKKEEDIYFDKIKMLKG